VLLLAGVVVIVWNLVSLSPNDRGTRLLTGGVFRYFRHPLYAAFLLFIDFGVVCYFNHWIYLI